MSFILKLTVKQKRFIEKDERAFAVLQGVFKKSAASRGDCAFVCCFGASDDFGNNPDDENTVLELGVGTGAFTKLLREIVRDERSYLGIELDETLAANAKEKFSGLRIVQGSAVESAAIHCSSGLGTVRYIISGLPFASLPEETSREIFREIDKFMREGCLFRTFQYAHAFGLPPAIKFRALMNERYGAVQKSRVVMKNVPPAYTLTWKTARSF